MTRAARRAAWRCDWVYASDLHLANVYPTAGRALMRRAFAEWPLAMKAEPVSVSGAPPDLYNLADVYVMPSPGEGFGFVFLEAMACGVPVIGSKVDGGREALLDGKLGLLVDPTNHAELRAPAVLASLFDSQNPKT